MPYNLLLVDDDEITRNIIQEYLKNYDILNILTAESGERAIDVIEKQKIHIVLLDISMPGMDGIEVLKVIKKIDPIAQVIMMTAHSTMERIIESLINGAIDYIPKPFKSAEEIRKLIDISLERLERWKEVLKYTSQHSNLKE